MTRRAPLPGAAELFRPTSAVPRRPGGAAPTPGADGSAGDQPHALPDAPRRGSGRQKHDAKITVYVSDDELVALEQARLALRAEHGLAVDRGRIVREAVAVLLADLDQHGADSVLVRRLRAESNA
ncbi:hypothetical protein LX15_005009 [Streptoalloteichus tenebrarius]|uniref:Cobyrinic acid a,c-diamide synthase n=1 Tax=Streptoalloteichus tenebrarius (strain ATCC 17920 / DSM 40477 / JCM 4838 / CBS 697.72 / NBRC 16177 / NCIMB 11028 / NRRL B-12390 / A12253. 1 / ISP 5477) TaxID=1933 RepID=A0ABT1I0H1_STRSD|nr:hypothetical protein [Streptoalloteichus tenebrarius]MCP2261288.1 hypothetical protein [Streptoalloteichus tenebrarius]BFF03686.1 hypothetical protein GCM10020241_53610 [Streptoalloteichus tenebrarius]